jgi:hypothetical protein
MAFLKSITKINPIPLAPFTETVKGDLRRNRVISGAKAPNITRFRRFTPASRLGRAGVGLTFEL